ncbi:MAG: hypothetical protein CSA54_01055 [Gammaproteobacteria bacterium]|nr:MAG: hypothetical protein CSA54_01055 [Gammaproteobacteria bacterium]
MKDKGRFGTLLRVAEARESLCARALGEAQSQSDRLSRQLEELRVYAGEYRTPAFMAAGQAAGNAPGNAAPLFTPAGLVDKRLFLARLDRNIAAVEQRMTLVERHLEQRREQWQAARARRKALESLREQHRQRAQEASHRREQRDADELSRHGSQPDQSDC